LKEKQGEEEAEGAGIAADKVLVVGGVIPQQDHEFLKEHGVRFIFGPGTRLTEAAVDIIDHLLATKC